MKNSPITVAFGSDLHLGPRDEDRRRRAMAFPDEADVIVLAGDIGVGAWASAEVFDLAEAFPSADIVFVAGNHEFYGHQIDDQLQHYRDLCAEEERVHFLENDSVTISGVQFIGCTLWTDFSVLGQAGIAMKMADQGISDFELIRKENGERFTPQDAALRFELSHDYLQKTLRACDPGNTVIVTHFAPGLMTHNPMFPINGLTAYFQANVKDLIERYQPATWIYGHNHYSSDLDHGRTRILSNQLGYRSEWGDIPRYDAARVVRAGVGEP